MRPPSTSATTGSDEQAEAPVRMHVGPVDHLDPHGDVGPVGPHPRDVAPQPQTNATAARIPSAGRVPMSWVAVVLAVVLVTSVTLARSEGTTATRIGPAGPALADAPTGPVAPTWSRLVPADTVIAMTGRSVALAHAAHAPTDAAHERDDAVEGAGDLLALAGHDLLTGVRTWQRDVAPDIGVVVVDPATGAAGQLSGLPGAQADGVIPPATAVRAILALDAATGAVLWRRDLQVPGLIRLRDDGIDVVDELACALVDVATGEDVVRADAPCRPTTTGATLVTGRDDGIGWVLQGQSAQTRLPPSRAIPRVDGTLAAVTDGTSMSLEHDGTRLWQLPAGGPDCPAIDPVTGVGAVVVCTLADGMQIRRGTVVDVDGATLAQAETLRHLLLVDVAGQPAAVVWEYDATGDRLRAVALSGPRSGTVLADVAASTEVLRSAGSAPATRQGVVAVIGPPGMRELVLLRWPDMAPTWRVPLTGGVVVSVHTSRIGVALLQRNGDGSALVTALS